jgi:endoglucanase Acf2
MKPIPFLLALILSPPLVAAEPVTAGKGSYLRGLPAGVRGPDAAPRIEPADQRRVPTNKWWSALAWTEKEFTQFPHPLAVKPTPLGLRVMYPGAKITASNGGIFGSMPRGDNDFIVSIAGVEKFAPPLPETWSDWFVTARFEEGARKLRTSYGRGSPFVFATCEGGAPRVIFSAPPKVWSRSAATLGVSVGERHYGLFAPSSETWGGLETAEFTADRGAYFSVAVLPDDRPETLALFARHAHAHVTDTAVEWAYDEKTQAVTTTFRFTTAPREGTEKATLTALYPHQWRHAATPLLEASYGSVRGPMRLAAGVEFQTRATFPGVLPWLPPTGAATREQVAESLRAEGEAFGAAFKDTYWEGKRLGRTATLAALADSAGLPEATATLHTQLRARLEGWFTATPGKKSGVFAYEPRWGTLIGYPASFGSDDQLNDHHFHYGYYLKAAAEIARRDPAWAGDAQWGPMLRLLVRDIANPRRDDAEFPFMRCFDPYAGHSWASGHSRFEDGNNNESSSEAMNAWAGMVLLGEATGDRALRDLGAWLFTTEMTAIEDYWFGVHGDTFPKEYPASVVTMVWGGKGANATWFSADPQMVHGINFLPITGASLYLGRFPDYCWKNYDALRREHTEHVAKEAAKKGRPAPEGEPVWTSWPDITWQYRSLSDPADALAQWRAAEAAGKPIKLEDGGSRPALAHWLQTFARLGTIDRTVTADTPTYAVFSKVGKRTHAAYNSGAQPRTVRFSDGATLQVAPRAWATDAQQ